MGLFRKRQSDRVRPAAHQPAAPEQDDALPLSVDDAAQVRRLVRAAFAQHGREVTVHADHVVDDEGAQYGLWNLAATLGGLAPRERQRAVEQHVRVLLEGDDLETLSDDELQRSTFLRPVERAGVPDPDWHPTALALGQDVLVVLAVDRPEQVSTPAESFWAARGGLERWRRAGLDNVRRLLAEGRWEHDRFGGEQERDGAGSFDVVQGESFFTASLALTLEDVVARFAPGSDTSRGVLVAMPTRHLVAFHVVRPGGSAMFSVQHLFGFALRAFDEQPGPVSPHVYWVRHGDWRQITRIDPETSQASVEVDEELAQALDILQ